MDTIVFGTGMPCVLAFLDHDIDDVAATWESWVQTGRFVRARHDDPTRDAVIGFLPAAIGPSSSFPTIRQAANGPTGCCGVTRTYKPTPTPLTCPRKRLTTGRSIRSDSVHDSKPFPTEAVD